MSTTRDLIGSLQVALKKTFDDSDITLAQISYWVSFFINKFNSIKQQTGTDNGLYLSVFTEVPIQVSSVNANPNLVAGRKYFILPSGILDLPNDGGINYISYMDFDGACQNSFTATQFTRTTPKRARVIYFDLDEKPTPSNPYFYVVGNYVYLLGVECVQFPYVEVGLVTTFDPFSSCDLDSEIALDPALFADVYKSVLDLGRFVMLIPNDNLNDASDTNTGNVPTQKLVSVNQEPQTQE